MPAYSEGSRKESAKNNLRQRARCASSGCHYHVNYMTFHPSSEVASTLDLSRPDSTLIHRFYPDP